MNIGILGGTFNPIHNGHLHIAEAACKEIPLDRLIWILTALPPLKTEGGLLDVQLRRGMVRLAIQGRDHWELSDLESDESKPSYTVDSVEWLSKKFPRPQHKLYLLIGSDKLTEFPSWKDSARILKLAEVVAMTRPGYSLRLAQGPMRLIPISPLNISASKIRKLIQQGQSVKGMVPELVREYIEKRGIYGS